MRQPPGRRLAVALCLTLPAILLPALPAQAAPTYVGLLAGPSVAATYPSGVEYDDVNGRLVVADTGLDRIEFYSYEFDGTPSWTKLPGQFGSHGTGNGQFDTPRDIAIDETGAIYVADAGNNRVQKFSSTGVFQWTTPPGFSDPRSLNTPIGLTWDAVNDVVLVASTGQDSIKAFNANGSLAWQSPPGIRTNGLQAGEIDIDAPRDVTRGPDGRLWIADYHHHRVAIYDVTPPATAGGTATFTDGNAGAVGIQPGQTLGSNGSGVGNLNFPYNVDFSPDGSIAYVSDTGNNRVARWDISGASPQWLTPLGGNCPESPEPCLDPPADLGWIDTLRRVVIDPAGRPVTADFWGNGMQVWTSSTSVGNGNTDAMLLQIELQEAPAPGFAQAFGVATASDGKIYAVDRLNQRLEYFDANGAFVRAAGNRGTSQGRFSWPEAVAVDPSSGVVWAADTRGDRIQRWPATLSSRSTFSRGTTGSGVGQFNYPEDLDVAPDGVVFIADTRNDRIQMYDPAADPAPQTNTGSSGLSVFPAAPASGSLNDPQGVVATSTSVFVADTLNDRILKFSRANGSQQAVSNVGLSDPQGIGLASDGTLWVADTGNHRIVHLSANLENLNHTFGSRGTGGLQFEFPHTVAAHGTRLYVADTFNDRVQIVDVSSLGGGTTDTTPPPAPTITSPTAGQTFTSVPVTFSGSATDNVGVGKVEVAIRDRTQGLWLQADDTWASSYRKRLSTLGSPGAASTTWSYAWTPPASGSGAYSVQVVVTDTSNLVATTKPTRQFDVTTGGGGGSYAPDFRIVNPGGVAPLYPAGGTTAPSGVRYVADSGGSRIVQISPTGVQSVVSAGAPWNDPRDVDVDVSDPAVLWVANTSASQIVKLRTDGTVLATFNGGGLVNQPYGIAEDATGVYVANTYATNPGANAVLKLNKTTGAVIWARGTCGTSFLRPRDVAVGSNGQVFVADTDRNRIVRLNPTTGACAGSFGTTGSNPGQLRAPRALASDGAGGIWVAEGGNDRIQHFTNAGAYISGSALGGFGEGNGQFRSAHCVFMDGDLVAVCDTFNYRIQRFSVNASGVPSFLDVLGGTAPANGGFNGAFDVAYGPDGSMYVSDWFNHRIQKFDANGNHVVSWGGYGSPNGSFIFPRGIAVKADGTVVVTDSENNRIDLLSPTGSFLGSIRPSTTPNLLRPHQTAIGPDGTYWVADTGNNRVINLNASGSVLRTISGVSQPRGVAVDASGNVYVSTGSTVRKIAPNGTSTTLATTGGGNTQVRTPYGLRIVGSGASAQLLIADRGNDRVLVLTLSGQYVTQFGAAGSGDGPFTFPQGVDRHPTTGQIAVADFGNNRVSVWAPG